MKKSVILILLFSGLPLIVSAQLKIGIIGDQTGADNIQEAYSVLQQGCETIKDYKPQIVLHVGDIVESSKHNNQIKTDFKQATGYLNSIMVKGKHVPWYLTAGDHDVNPPDDYTPGTKDYSKQKLFFNLLKHEYSSRSPSLSIQHLYYSFNFQGYHFICLYSEDFLRTDPRWGDIFMDKISDKQYKWLEAELNSGSGSKGTIIFLHQPMWYNQTGWARVHNLLRKHNVIAVIAGHFHYNQDEGKRDGIRYIVVGSTGGTTKNASETAGGIYHVTLMTVTNDDDIGLELIPLGSLQTDLTFTDRKDMDRIQAIDTMITSFPSDDYNKKAVEANPIDIPVDIMSSQDGTSWSNAYPHTVPGKGVSISNLSSVELQGPPYQKVPNSTDSPGGTRVEFSSNGQVFWDQILYNNQQTNKADKKGAL